MERTLLPYNKLDVSKKGLLLIAGIIWLLAGSMLINRSTGYLLENSHHILFHFLIGFGLGIILFAILFFKISKKYTERIININEDKPVIFSFASFRGYILIITLIGIGLYLRRTEYIDHLHLSIAYICIGFGIVFSSVKFFYSVITFKKLTTSK